VRSRSLGFVATVPATRTHITSTFSFSDQPTGNRSLVTSNESSRNLRFVQLYTSKAYQNRRSELVEPPNENEDDDDEEENNGVLSATGANSKHDSTAENLQKHVLSPRLVEAIAKTTQVVWANSRKREGLLGRSDIRLQTAVGMPVAVDDLGNMCVVVMFSPNNIHSSDDAMEYLQNISRCATTASIPGLLPVFDPDSSHMKQLTYAGSHYGQQAADMNSLGDGVTARYVSLDQSETDAMTEPEIHNVHELTDAPKDTFGIPMLPTFAEIGNVTPEGEELEIFDEASYGIWTTIMDTLNDDNLDVSFGNAMDFSMMNVDDRDVQDTASWASDLQVVVPGPAPMPESRVLRLEEFCSAFLDMSVFDLADVWVPVGVESQYPDCLRHVTSVTSSDENISLLLQEFRSASANTLIKFWTGAIGRAHSSGNPVWSANPNVFMDPGRSAQFRRTKIMTVLAVPIFSGKSAVPACVVACYSLVKSGSVPFVLRFVQSALRLLWDGLDKVEPHESVGKHMWQDLAPADLGEMAADVEMQHHFMSKKRPRTFSISEVIEPPCPTTSALASNLQAVRLPNGDSSATFVSTEPMRAPRSDCGLTDSDMQDQLYQAIRSAALSIPYEHVSTVSDGSKRAHVDVPLRPLPLPHRFPTTIVSSDQSVSSESSRSGAGTPLFNAAVFVIPFDQSTGVESPDRGNNVLGLANKFGPIEFSNSAAPVSNAFRTVDFSNTVGSVPYCMPADMSMGRDNMSTTDSVDEVTQCRIIGCEETASSRRPYCLQHCGNRLCEHDGCGKCAQGSTRFCIAHGGGRRCTHPGCDKGARDKFFCAAHGGGKRCSADGCNKSAVGGSSLCTAHGGGRRCDVEGCDKSAQSSTRFCVKHGGGKKCSHEGCEKVARGRTLFCAAHGGGVRCKLEGCNRVAIGKLQLCRAHGGGSRLKKNRVLPPLTHSTSPILAPFMST
jgi:hypothetical protein